MIIQKLRVDRGWSQEELAAHSGLSVRTIQRIENGKRASLESLKCLAAVFEYQVSDLIQENPMNDTQAFHMNWITFIIVMPFMYWLNIKLTPGFLWVSILAATWILAIVLQAVLIFGLFSVFSGAWQQREFQKRMSRRNR